MVVLKIEEAYAEHIQDLELLLANNATWHFTGRAQANRVELGVLLEDLTQLFVLHERISQKFAGDGRTFEVTTLVDDCLITAAVVAKLECNTLKILKVWKGAGRPNYAISINRNND